MSFDTFVQKHDPDSREDWTFPFKLNEGESLTSAVVAVVDSTSTTVDVATDLVIESTAFGVISGTLWGVTIWVSGGTPGNYYLRCRVETSSAPGQKTDKTNRLVCAEL